MRGDGTPAVLHTFGWLACFAVNGFAPSTNAATGCLHAPMHLGPRFRMHTQVLVVWHACARQAPACGTQAHAPQTVVVCATQAHHMPVPHTPPPHPPTPLTWGVWGRLRLMLWGGRRCCRRRCGCRRPAELLLLLRLLEGQPGDLLIRRLEVGVEGGEAVVDRLHPAAGVGADEVGGRPAQRNVGHSGKLRAFNLPVSHRLAAHLK